MSYASAGSEPGNLCLENGGRNVKRKEVVKKGKKLKRYVGERLCKEHLREQVEAQEICNLTCVF